MKIFRRNISTTSTTAMATAMATAAKEAAKTARKVETAKNFLAVYGGVRLALDVWNAVKVARLIKAGKIYQGEDGYWYYADTHPQEEGGDEDEEAQ